MDMDYHGYDGYIMININEPLYIMKVIYYDGINYQYMVMMVNDQYQLTTPGLNVDLTLLWIQSEFHLVIFPVIQDSLPVV